MKIDSRFPRRVVVTFVIGAGSAAYPVWKFGSQEIAVSAAAGAVLSTINVMLGYLAIEYSFEKSHTTFLKAVLGGMGVRMLLMLLVLWILIKFFGFHPLALTLSMLSFYVVYLILEVLFIQQKVFVKDQG